MTDAVTSPDEHIFFACDMGPTRNSVLVAERERGRMEDRVSSSIFSSGGDQN